jgi:hypothetical protein
MPLARTCYVASTEYKGARKRDSEKKGELHIDRI